jgi:hypothetical protein
LHRLELGFVAVAFRLVADTESIMDRIVALLPVEARIALEPSTEELRPTLLSAIRAT